MIISYKENVDLTQSKDSNDPIQLRPQHISLTNVRVGNNIKKTLLHHVELKWIIDNDSIGAIMQVKSIRFRSSSCKPKTTRSISTFWWTFPIQWTMIRRNFRLLERLWPIPWKIKRNSSQWVSAHSLTNGHFRTPGNYRVEFVIIILSNNRHKWIQDNRVYRCNDFIVPKGLYKRPMSTETTCPWITTPIALRYVNANAA